MANIKPPTKTQKTAPVANQATAKLSQTELKPIQIKVSPGEHQAIKIFAAERNMSIKDLFLTMFEGYKADGN